MFGVDMGTIPCGFGAWAIAQRLHLMPSRDQGFQPMTHKKSKSLLNQCGFNGTMMDPYPHPQHMKVVKRLVYVWSGYGNHSMWVLSF
jgi:hypothetical protein